MTQGDPLDMITDGIGILLIICETRATHPTVMQPWYNDDTGTVGKFVDLQAHLDYLIIHDTCRDSSPIQPRASWLSLQITPCGRNTTPRRWGYAGSLEANT